MDKSNNPRGVNIEEYSWIFANAVVLAHDHCRGLNMDNYIANHCVSGINAIIMPGVKIGNHVVVGSGAVVTKDVERHCIVVRNPARVVKEGINVDDKGQIVEQQNRKCEQLVSHLFGLFWEYSPKVVPELIRV